MRTLVLATLLIGNLSLGAQDFLRFLQENRWQVLSKPAGLSTEMGPFQDEYYFVKDEWGNEYTLNLFERTDTLRILASHEFAEAVGLLRIPVYPVLARRGFNGVPTEAEIRQGLVDHLVLAPEEIANGKYKAHFSQNIYYPALLLPRIPVMQPIHPPTTADELTDTLKQALFRLALGATSLHYGVLDDQRQHFFLANGIFSQLANEIKWADMKSAMTDVPFRSLRALSEADAAKVVEEISGFLDRVEWVAENHADSMFAASNAAIIDDLGINAPFIPKLKRRISGLRPLTEKHFNERIGGHFRCKLEKRPLPREVLYTAPRYGLVRFLGQSPVIPTNSWERRANARNLLEAFYLATNARRREMILEWSRQLGTDGDPIAFLMREARDWDGTLRLINSKVRLSSENNFELERRERQLFLNRNLPPTLVVFSPNDAESREANRVLEEVSGQLPFFPMPLQMRPGETINRPKIDAVLAEAKAKGVSHVLFGEIRGVRTEDRQRLSEANLTVEFLDHHEEAEMTAWNPYSWLEQLFHKINYQPDLQQYLSGLIDRSGLHGFRQVRWDIGDLTAYLTRFRPDLVELRRPIQSIFDTGGQDVILMMGDHGDLKFGEVSYAANWESYPKIANGFMQRQNSVIFFGNATLAMELLEVVRTTEPGLKAVRGGDIGATVFVILRPRDAKTGISGVVQRLRDRIAAGELFGRSCAIEVSLRHKT